MSDRLPDHAHPIVTAVRRFLETEALPVASSLEHADAYPHDLVARMRALGLFGALFPEADGGLGLDPDTAVMTVEEAAHGSGTLASLLAAHLATGLVAGSTAPAAGS